MDSDEHIPAGSPLELFPTEIWLKIISFLPFDDRCRVEGVSHQLSEAAKTTWAEVKSLTIAAPMVDSAAKLATLLRRCGSHLDEIIVGRHIRLDTEAPLFQLCSNLKVLSFTNGTSFSLDNSSRSGDSFQQPSARVHSFIGGLRLGGMPKLERMQFFSKINPSQDQCEIVTLADMVHGMVNFPRLQELHLPVTSIDGPSLMHIGHLQHTRVLSITIPYHLVMSRAMPPTRSMSPVMSRFASTHSLSYVLPEICQLHQLEQLYLRLDPEITRLLERVVARLAKKLPNLNSLVLRFGYYSSLRQWYIPVGCIDVIIGQFSQLRTLVIVCANQQRFEGNSTGPVPIDLSQHRHRQLPLNIFVVDYNLPEVHFHSNFIGYSPQINVIPMPNDRYGEAIEYLSSYSQNGFDFANEKCLQMVRRSAQFKGEWDFSYGTDEDAEDN